MKLIMLIVCLLTVFKTNAQDSSKVRYPAIGNILENYSLTDIENYPQNVVSTSNFKGKWLILDFWAYTCSACIASFPKMNKLYKDFNDRVQFFMIGVTKSHPNADREHNEKITKVLFNKLKEKYDLQLPVAFDSVLYMKYDVNALPHIIIINPEGKVVRKVVSIDSLQLSLLLANKDVDFQVSLSRHEQPTYNYSIPLLTNGRAANGGNDTNFIFRSLLTADNPSMQGSPKYYNLFSEKHKKYIESGSLECIRYSLQQLYSLAYFGATGWSAQVNRDFHKSSYPDIIFETKNQSIINQFKYLTRYSYSLKVPPKRSTRDYLMYKMTSDLRDYFQFNVSKEKREVTVYSFEVADTAKLNKLVSKGGKPGLIRREDYSGFDVTNLEPSEFIMMLSAIMKTNLPIIDNTKSKIKIDLNVTANLINTDQIISELKKVGFEIKKTKMKMACLVVKD